MNGNDLAALSGVTAATISRYLNGLRTPTVDNVVLLADALDVSVDYLLGRHNVPDDKMLVSLYSIASSDDKRVLWTLLETWKDTEETMEQLNGNEPFTLHGSGTSIMLQDFWRWAYSDLLNNTHRGVLAEFLVHSALETKDVARADWLPFDLTSPSGLRIEVKSSAYLQAWTPEDVFSQISFDIAKKFAWDGATYASMAMRNSDLYVFCVFTARTRDVSILDLDYWDFYVLPTSVLNEKVPEQKTITLSSLLKLEPAKTDFAGLPAAVESVRLSNETT